MKRKVQAEKKKNCDYIGFDGCCEIIDGNVQKRNKDQSETRTDKRQKGGRGTKRKRKKAFCREYKKIQFRSRVKNYIKRSTKHMK